MHFVTANAKKGGGIDFLSRIERSIEGGLDTTHSCPLPSLMQLVAVGSRGQTQHMEVQQAAMKMRPLLFSTPQSQSPSGTQQIGYMGEFIVKLTDHSVCSLTVMLQSMTSNPLLSPEYRLCIDGIKRCTGSSFSPQSLY